MTDNPKPVVSNPVCPRCGETMHFETVRSAIWRDDSLVVVEDIPAAVCSACVEQYYDEPTTDALRQLTEQGFPPSEATKQTTVPVFSLRGRIRAVPPPDPDAEENFFHDL